MKRLLIALLVLFALPAIAQQTQYIPRLKTDSLTTKTANNVYYAKQYATAGSGTQADPWTGWSTAIAANTRIHFSAGYYSVPVDTTINVPSNSDLEGDGSAWIIPAGDDTGTYGLLTIDASASDVTNVKIRNLNFDGNSKNRTYAIRGRDGASSKPTSVYVTNCRFSNFKKVAIVAGAASDMHVEGNYFYNVGSATTGANAGGAIHIGSATNTGQGLFITGNYIDTYGNASSSGSGTHAAISVILGESNAIISHNFIYNGIKGTSPQVLAINATNVGSTGVVITDNIIRSIEGTGVNVTGTAANSKRVLVSGNVVDTYSTEAGDAHPGMFLATLNDLVVSNNVITGGGASANDGIEMNTVRNATFNGNTIGAGRTAGGYAGIYVSGYGITVSGNTVVPTAASPSGAYTCVTVAAGDTIKIVGNTLKECGAYGIYGNSATANMDIDGNLISDTDAAADGVLMQYGVLVGAGVTRSTVRNNLIFGYGTAATSFNASSTITDYGNITSATAVTGALDTVVLLGKGLSLSFEGATRDSFRTTLSVADPTANRTATLPDASGTVVLSTLATNGQDVANGVWGESNAWVFEGASADAFETRIQPTDPTADQTLTLPNLSGTFAVGSASGYTICGDVTFDSTANIGANARGTVSKAATMSGFTQATSTCACSFYGSTPPYTDTSLFMEECHSDGTNLIATVDNRTAGALNTVNTFRVRYCCNKQ